MNHDADRLLHCQAILAGGEHPFTCHDLRPTLTFSSRNAGSACRFSPSAPRRPSIRKARPPSKPRAQWPRLLLSARPATRSLTADPPSPASRITRVGVQLTSRGRPPLPPAATGLCQTMARRSRRSSRSSWSTRCLRLAHTTTVLKTTLTLLSIARTTQSRAPARVQTVPPHHPFQSSARTSSPL